MSRLLRSELVKLRATRSAWVIALGAVAAALALTAMQLGFAVDPATNTTVWGDTAERFADPADTAALVDIGILIAMVTAVLGALALPTEFRYETITPTFLAAPSRARIVAAKAVVVATFAAGVAAVGQMAVLALSAVWLAAVGGALAFDSGVASILALTPLAAGLAAVMGVGIGAAVRQQVTAVLVVAGWFLIIEQLIAGIVPDMRPFLPFVGAVSALAGGGTTDLTAAAGAVALVAYAIAALLTGGVLLRRRDLA